MSDENVVSFGGSNRRRKKVTEESQPKEEIKVDESKTEDNEYHESYVMSAGDRSRYLYIDCEFTGLKKNTQLISIAVVDADGRSFYGEVKGIKTESLDPWIQENVIGNLLHPDTVEEGDHWSIEGSKAKVKASLLKWLEYYKDRKIMQIVSDCGHYDFVLFIDLVAGNALNLTPDKSDLPVAISPVLHDINQDMASSIKTYHGADLTGFIPDFSAFDINREEAVGAEDVEAKHNSLHDAYIIRQIHQYIWQL